MKTNVLKKALAYCGLLLLPFACVKTIDPPSSVKHDDGEVDHGACKCPHTAKGTIERCPNDSNLWFINAIPGNLVNGPSPVPVKLLVPVNLPAAYKVNALTVKFDYTLFSDSVKLACWFCATPPVPYGRYIRICNIQKDSNTIIAMKPVIYLYPEKETRVNVRLNFQGKFTITYPDYSAKLGGWEVMAKPSGDLTNLADNSEHQYLFWEGAPEMPYHFNMTNGYCVKGADTKDFLKKMLPRLGLSPKEYNDMIVFWLPKMMNNNYNLIHFAGESYTQSAPLDIRPRPDNLIRVFMVFQPSKTFVKTMEPKIITPSRKGYTAVEWGGTELPEKAETTAPAF